MYIYIYIYVFVYDSQEKIHFFSLSKYFGVMLSSVICAKLFLQFFLYSTVNKKE